MKKILFQEGAVRVWWGKRKKKGGVGYVGDDGDKKKGERERANT